jgi:hypothetical protein
VGKPEGKRPLGRPRHSDINMAESGVVVCNGSLENNVSTGKWNVNENCVHCLNLGREVGRLHQELSLANEIIKILKILT